MSNGDRLARLHEFLKDPFRRKILLKLGEHDKLSFDELIRELKIGDQEELYDELKNLGELVTKVKDDQYPLPREGISEPLSEQYMLTEEGHDAVDEMIAYPEIESDSYRESFDNNGEPKKPIWGTTYKAVIVFLAIIIVATIIIFFLASYFHLKNLRGFGY